MPKSNEKLLGSVGHAVETGSTEFDDENLSGIAYISSVCAGLITIDESSDQVRLVHYTTYDFLTRSLPS